jgi:hypothetical protein
MLAVYLFIGLIILSLILLVISYLALRNIRANASFNTNARIKTAGNWSIGAIVSSLFSLLLSIGGLIVLRIYNGTKTGTLIFLIALIILGTFAVIIFGIITLANFSTIYVILTIVGGFIGFILGLILFLNVRKLPIYVVPIVNGPTVVGTGCVIPEPEKFYIVKSNLETVKNFNL